MHCRNLDQQYCALCTHGGSHPFEVGRPGPRRMIAVHNAAGSKLWLQPIVHPSRLTLPPPPNSPTQNEQVGCQQHVKQSFICDQQQQQQQSSSRS
jgi:hypothetical protein